MAPCILVANRGEIAVRLLNAVRDVGLRAVAVYALDEDKAHCTDVDASYKLSGGAQAFLDVGQIVQVAREAGATHVHPGYGYLSESAEFARALHQAGIAFIGPDADLLAACGSKLSARDLALRSRVPVIPGTQISTASEVARFAKDTGFPVMLKAVDGGGGRGIRIVRSADEIEVGLKRCKGESPSGEVFVEKALDGSGGSRWKHIEVQIVGDGKGTVAHLGERECSVQRRHQKMVEQAPSTLPPELADEVIDAAVRFASDLKYSSLGTFEFLVDPQARRFCFLEINPRIQVEHTVTEMVTGVDLVEIQIQLALGTPLSSLNLPHSSFRPSRVAIQARVTAEDPSADFALSTGPITSFHFPSGPNVRVDTWLRPSAPLKVTPFFDSLLAKVVVSAPTLQLASARLSRALQECEIDGVTTNSDVLEAIVESEDWRRGRCWIGWLEGPSGRELMDSARQRHRRPPADPPSPEDAGGSVLLRPKTSFHLSLAPASGSAQSHSFTLSSISANNFPTKLSGRLSSSSSAEDISFTLEQDQGPGSGRSTERGDPSDPSHVIVPATGQLVQFSLQEGHRVKQGDELGVLSMMKMETVVNAPFDAVVERIGSGVKEGEMMGSGALLCMLRKEAKSRL